MNTRGCRAVRAWALIAVAGAILSLGGCSPPVARDGSGTLAPLFTGHDLAGWKGLVADPPRRARMSEAELAAAQVVADERMRAHWRVEMIDGEPALHFDGKGDNLCTARDFGDFEMMVDWKVPKGGDSGIYLRGSPQVQIWDNPIGSGGLYNNQKHRSTPLVVADRPVGAWNTLRIRMVGEQVWVWLNGALVVDGVVMENYWERDRPIPTRGAIELQAHGGPLWFRNLYVRELGESQRATKPPRRGPGR